MVARLFLLLCLVWPANVFGQEWRALLSPGPVAQDHEKSESDCDRCHLVFKGIPNEKCEKCHDSLRKFHDKVKKQLCIDCHTDHGGRKGAQTKAAALASFDHADTGFDLVGKHEKLECKDCHTAPISKMAAQCSGCHEDPHESKLGQSCQSCHNNDSWKTGIKTIEQHLVRMDGGHQGQSCVDCHAKGGQLQKEVGCESCHERGHGGTKAPCQNCHNVAAFKPAKFDHAFCTCKFPGKHRTVSCLSCHVEFDFTKTPTLCSGCHKKDQTHDWLGECSLCHSALSWKKNRFDHNKRSKFQLADAHLTVDCDRCHFQKKRNRVQFKQAPSDCKGCHADDGLQAHGDFGGCEPCHTTRGFEISIFDHTSTGFPLTGRHKGAKCQDCHAEKTKGFPSKKTSSTFTQGPTFAMLGDDLILSIASQVPPHSGTSAFACGHCHEDPHQGQAKEACESCHSTETWVPSTFDLKRHEETKFPLKGKHREGDCSSCHVGGQLTGMPTVCAGCHVDVHREKFGSDCTKCHSEVGFSPVEGFDHSITGFALSGFHAGADCASCHEGDRGQRLGTAQDKQACSTCHAPKHAKDLKEACTDCHADTVKFADARFKHEATGFRLERRHAALKCAHCHVDDPTGLRPKVTSRCTDCHFEPHMGQLTTTCQRCHEPDRWSLVRYDHDRAGWPLRGRHFVTGCMECHTNQRWVGLTTDCYDCHALDAARGAARVPQAHPFGRLDCTDCHFNGFSWR